MEVKTAAKMAKFYLHKLSKLSKCEKQNARASRFIQKYIICDDLKTKQQTCL